MKIILLFMIFIVSSVNATPCLKYNLKGHVRVIDKRLWLIINQKTGSEKKLPIKLQGESKFSPYINHFVNGDFLLEGPVNTNVKLLSVVKIESSFSDPLRQNEDNTIRKIVEIKCPKL